MFIRFTCLEENISCILNSVCINIYITYHKNDFFLQFLFYALSNDVSKFYDITSSTLVTLGDSILKEIFPPRNSKLFFLQKQLKIDSDM